MSTHNNPATSRIPSSLFLSKQADDDDNTAIANMATLGVVLLSTLSSLGVFWSEIAVFQTGCGPMLLPDWLERSAYLGVLVVSGLSLFWRIVTFGEGGLAYVLLDNTANGNPTVRRTFLQGVEVLVFLAVSGAVLVLMNQTLNGQTMDGLSGIDLDMCAARRAFQAAAV